MACVWNTFQSLHESIESSTYHKGHANAYVVVDTLNLNSTDSIRCADANITLRHTRYRRHSLMPRTRLNINFVNHRFNSTRAGTELHHSVTYPDFWVFDRKDIIKTRNKTHRIATA